MKFKKYIPFILIGLFAMAACKKNNPTVTSPKTSADVYVAGFVFINSNTSSNTAIATYWKNGVEHKVNDSSTYSIAYAIAVQGTDVYMAGYTRLSSGVTQATYWKNGVAINLTQQGSSEAIAMAVNGPDIYVTGYIHGNTISNYYLMSWKNGLADTVAPGKIYPNGYAIAVNGSDIYIAGTSSVNVSGEQATYWKNGAISILDNATFSSAYAIAINGSDVYIAGTVGVGLNTTLTYWKNGIINTVTQSGNITVSSIIVNKNDIYIGGSTYNGGTDTTYTPVATYWKNGVASSLERSSLTSYVLGMAINGTDVYAVGSVGESVSNVTPAATYWKNGVAVKLSQNLSIGYAIAVVPRQ